MLSSQRRLTEKNLERALFDGLPTVIIFTQLSPRDDNNNNNNDQVNKEQGQMASLGDDWSDVPGVAGLLSSHQFEAIATEFRLFVRFAYGLRFG